MKLVFQLHRFAIDAAHSKTIFSAAGVFNVDRELLLAVIYFYFFYVKTHSEFIFFLLQFQSATSAIINLSIFMQSSFNDARGDNN